MTDFKVVSTELDSASGQFQQLQATAGQLTGRLSAISLGPTDFGMLPGQGSLYAAYRQNMSECRNTLQEASSSLEAVSQGLAETSHNYAEMERKACESIATYFSGV